METENKGLIDVRDCPCDGCQAKPCGHPARCVKFTLWLNKTVDAVEVVRCKDCKYSIWDEDEGLWKCVYDAEFDEKYGEYFGFAEYNDGLHFCSCGERKDNV